MSDQAVLLNAGLRSLYEQTGQTRPHQLVKDLGIQYERSEPVTIGDCWLFHGCRNVPDELPRWLSRVDWT